MSTMKKIWAAVGVTILIAILVFMIVSVFAKLDTSYKAKHEARGRAQFAAWEKYTGNKFKLNYIEWRETVGRNSQHVWESSDTWIDQMEREGKK